MLRITTVQMPAVANPGQNWLSFINWLGESLRVEVSLPRKALSIPVLHNERLPHSAISAPDARFGFVHFDTPNMPATVTYRFVLFHRISVSALY